MNQKFSENTYKQLFGEQCLSASPEHFDVVWRLMSAQVHSDPGFLEWKNMVAIFGSKKIWGERTKEDLSVLSYWQGFQWMCEKLEEHHIPFNIQQLNMYSKVKHYDSDEHSEKAIANEVILKETEFFLEFEGQTWNPSFGFMFLEAICAVRNENAEKTYKFKKVDRAVMWEMLGMDCASPEDLTNIDAKVTKSFDEQWRMSSKSEGQEDLFLVSYNDGYVETCCVVQAPSHYAAPDDAFEVCREDQFLVQRLAELPKVPAEQLKNALVMKNADFSNFCEPTKGTKNKIQMEIMQAKQWHDAFTKVWHNLVDLQTEQGSEVIFLKSKKDHGKFETVSLSLDLGSQQTVENLYKLIGLKDKPLTLLHQDESQDCLGSFTDILSVEGLAVVIPSLSTPWNLNVVKMLKEIPDYRLNVFDTGFQNENFKELLRKWSLKYQLKQDLRPLSNPSTVPLRTPKLGRF